MAGRFFSANLLIRGAGSSEEINSDDFLLQLDDSHHIALDEVRAVAL
jgi:hypothetical protein